MSPVVRAYFDAIEERLIESSAIVEFRITRHEIGTIDGKLRLEATVEDGGEAEFFMYAVEAAGAIHLMKYSFHWQDADGQLRRRWDNALHHPDLQGAPHHMHRPDRSVWGVEPPPDFFIVIAEMERDLSD